MNVDGSKIVISTDMAYTIAAYHDTGLCDGRETHHLASGRIIRDDKKLLQWFTPAQIVLMDQATEDHRAASKDEPRSIYGRTVQYGLTYFPDLDKQAQYLRTLEHMHEKYAEGGYLRLWIPESPNAERLAQLRAIIRDEQRMREMFEDVYDELT
mgnify:CR=1 FL=1